MEEFRAHFEGKIIKIYCSGCGVRYKEIRMFSLGQNRGRTDNTEICKAVEVSGELE